MGLKESSKTISILVLADNDDYTTWFFQDQIWRRICVPDLGRKF